MRGSQVSLRFSCTRNIKTALKDIAKVLISVFLTIFLRRTSQLHQ